MSMKTIRSIFGPLGTLTFAFALTACQQPAQSPAAGNADETPAPAAEEETASEERAVQVAIAELQPTEGNETSGTVTFTKVEGGIQVVAEISGFGEGPEKRGFHIHEHGDCSAPDGTSAGGHFNPEGVQHGAPDSDERHIGDLGNLTIGPDGTATVDFIDPHLTFEGPNSILNRSVIVHAGEDDFETQPTGDAGGRVACGVIQIAEYAN